jgi:hypothetical protein
MRSSRCVEIKMWMLPILNRTPIVGLRKFGFDDRRCGSFVCVRIEGGITTTRSGVRRWGSSESASGTDHSPVDLPCRSRPRENGFRCTDPVARSRSWEATAANGTTGRGRSRPRASGSRSSGRGSRIWKSPGPAGVEVTRFERSAVVRLLAGWGHRLGHLLRISGLARSTYFYHLAHPAHATRPDLEPLMREIWERTANGCGHRQVRMCLASRVRAEGVRQERARGHAAHGEVPDPRREPVEAIPLVQGRDGRARAQPVQTRLRRRQAVRQARHRCHGVRGRRAKAYLAPVYDMAGKEIVAWDVRQHPDMDRQRRLLAMLAERLPGARSRYRTRTWDGSTGTNGGGRSSNG